MKHIDYSAIARYDYSDIPISGFPEANSRMIDNTRLCVYNAYRWKSRTYKNDSDR